MANGQEPNVYFLSTFSPDRIKELQVLRAENKLVKNLTSIVEASFEKPGEEKPLTLKLSLKVGPDEQKEVPISYKGDIEGLMNDLGVKTADEFEDKEIYTYWFEDKSKAEPVLKLVGISYAPHKKE